MKQGLGTYPPKKKPVEDRYCKTCGKRIPRDGLTPTKYKLKVYCSTPCRK